MAGRTTDVVVALRPGETAALGRPQEALLRPVAHAHLNLVHHVVKTSLLDLHVGNRLLVALDHHRKIRGGQRRSERRSTLLSGQRCGKAGLLPQVVLELRHLLRQRVDLSLQPADPGVLGRGVTHFELRQFRSVVVVLLDAAKFEIPITPPLEFGVQGVKVSNQLLLAL